jgi:hypothetical protein
VTEDSRSHDLLTWSAGRRSALGLIGVLLAGVLIFHFGVTALHHTPFNPVREKYDDRIHAYMSPYFQQDWHLFAPSPISEDTGFLVRARKTFPDGRRTTTPWADVSTPHITKLHRQRFWPSRVERLTPAVPQQLEGWRDPQLDKLRYEKNPPNVKVDGALREENLTPPLAPHELMGRDNALLYARAVATSEAAARWGDEVDAVQIRVVSNEYPRFSERRNRENKGKITYYDLAWMEPLRVAR